MQMKVSRLMPLMDCSRSAANLHRESYLMMSSTNKKLPEEGYFDSVLYKDLVRHYIFELSSELLMAVLEQV